MTTVAETISPPEVVAANQKFKRADWVNRVPEQVAFARQLYRLLQRPKKAKPQDDAGYGRQIAITPDDFEDHLFGGVTLAVAAKNEDGCNFLAWDCDERMGDRLPVYARVLERRGLAQAAFCTTGSTRGRGKVILTLAKRIPQPFAITLAKEIQDEVVTDSHFGAVKPSSLTCFPSAGDGSYCRILGRKYGDPASFEIIGNLQGYHLTDLSTVVPATIDIPVQIVTTTGARRLSSWARRFISEPFTGTEPELLRAQLRLTDEANKIFGDDADGKFAEWMELIYKNSPTVSPSVRRQLFRKDAFLKAKVHIAKNGAPRTWEPLTSLPYTPGVLINVTERHRNGTEQRSINVTDDAWRVYLSLATYALAHGLDPHAIGMDYQRLADLAGFDAKMQAHRSTLRAEACSILKRLHAGQRRDSGGKGQATLFCLRGEGETMQDAIAAGQCTEAYRNRMQPAPEKHEREIAPMVVTVTAPEEDLLAYAARTGVTNPDEPIRLSDMFVYRHEAEQQILF